MDKKLLDIAKHSDDPRVRFAECMQGLGDEKQIKTVCEHLRVPKAYQDLAVLSVLFSALITAPEDAETRVCALGRVDAFRKPERFQALLTVCEVRTIEQAKWLSALKACHTVDISALVAHGHQGDAMKKAVHNARVIAVQAIL